MVRGSTQLREVGRCRAFLLVALLGVLLAGCASDGRPDNPLSMAGIFETEDTDVDTRPPNTVGVPARARTARKRPTDPTSDRANKDRVVEPLALNADDGYPNINVDPANPGTPLLDDDERKKAMEELDSAARKSQSRAARVDKANSVRKLKSIGEKHERETTKDIEG